uniref:NADH-ubiquinone oxidoreductase chain 5 n=1 Tax=Bisetocreagris titanium TaxID=2836860 RepID=A0A8F7KJ93_9ARAC|nr:NADH dehydrogenase subunit 5 [Bisetocreagris titanium]
MYLNIYMFMGFSVLIMTPMVLVLGVYFYIYNLGVLVKWQLLIMGGVSYIYCIQLDWLLLLFMMVVTLISSMVIFYSYFYMAGEHNQKRFIYTLFLFILSMILMILSPSVESIMLGWDGLGFVSFALIFFYMSFKSYHSSMITILMNRLGDISFLIVMGWLFNYGMMNFINLNLISNFELKFIWLLVMISAFSKSAQIPLSAWLPAAMAAPTPVSSLVHSSTLVTAGVYVLIRLNTYYSLGGNSTILVLISLMTLIAASTSALSEMDLKKVIAMSTLSQLGFMLFLLGMGSWEVCYLHMLLHAVFKASLFLCAGLIIHTNYGVQDIRNMSIMPSVSPTTCIVFNTSCMSLMGIPFLGGFYGKEEGVFFILNLNLNFLLKLLFIVSLILTSSYSLRLLMYSLSGEINPKSYLWVGKSPGMEIIFIVMFLLMINSGILINYILISIFNLNLLLLSENYTTFILVFLGMSVMFKKLKVNKSFMLNNEFYGSLWFLFWLSGNLLLKMTTKFKNSILLELAFLEGYSGKLMFNFLIFNSYKLSLVSTSLKFVLLFLVILMM